MVEISPNNVLPDEFPVKMVDGSTRSVRVQYQWKPEICNKCSEFGHTQNCCDKVEINQGNLRHLDAAGDVSKHTGYDRGVTKDSGPTVKSSEHAKDISKRVPLNSKKQVWHRVNISRKKKHKSKAKEPRTLSPESDNCMGMEPNNLVVSSSYVNKANVNQDLSSNPSLIPNHGIFTHDNTKSNHVIRTQNQFSVLDEIEEGELSDCHSPIHGKCASLSNSKGKEKEVCTISPDECLKALDQFSRQVLTIDSINNHLHECRQEASTSAVHDSAEPIVQKLNSVTELVQPSAVDKLSPEKNITAAQTNKKTIFKIGFLNAKLPSSSVSSPANLDNGPPNSVAHVTPINTSSPCHASSETISFTPPPAGNVESATCSPSPQRRNKASPLSATPSHNVYAHIKAPAAYRPPPGFVNGVYAAEKTELGLGTDENTLNRKQKNDNRNTPITRRMSKKIIQEEENYAVP